MIERAEQIKTDTLDADAVRRFSISLWSDAAGWQPNSLWTTYSALLAAKSIGYSASASGTYLSTELFPRLGIATELALPGSAWGSI